MSRNKADNFSVNASGFTPPSYSAQSQSHFAYGLGLGARWLANSHLALDLSYHYFQLGKAALADDPNFFGSRAVGLNTNNINPSVLLLKIDFQL